jgi:8-oxo-dGTP diphosphatase
MKHIHVTCAIIERDGLVMAVQRSSSMSMPLKWEFPGGKIEPGESALHCMKRELFEELDITVNLLQSLELSPYQYPQLKITLYPFVCIISEGTIKLHEHAAIIWCKPNELHLLDWAEADIPVLNEYIRGKRENA